jgi:hypothetical protein
MYASNAAAAGYWSIDPQGLSSSRLPKMKRTALNRPKRQAVIQSAKANAFSLDDQMSLRSSAMVSRYKI